MTEKKNAKNFIEEYIWPGLIAIFITAIIFSLIFLVISIMPFDQRHYKVITEEIDPSKTYDLPKINFDQCYELLSKKEQKTFLKKKNYSSFDDRLENCKKLISASEVNSPIINY